MDTALTDPRLNQYDAPETEFEMDRMKEIRVAGTLSETKFDRGNFYLVDFNVAKGDDPIQTDLGKEIKVHILRHAMKVRKWDNQENRTVMDSSEFRTYTDPVVLYDVNMIPPRIVAALPYTHKNPELPSIGGKGDKSLKRALGLGVRHVFYVLFNGEVCRMNVTATDYSGANDKDKPMEFGKEAEDSFAGILHNIEKDLRPKLYLFQVTLRSRDHSKKIVLKTFHDPVMTQDSPEEKEAIANKLDALYKRLSEAAWHKFCKARENTKVEDLDVWSRMILEKIEKHSTDTLLYGRTKEVKVELQEGQVVDVPLLMGATLVAEGDVEDVAAEFGGDSKSEPTGAEAAAEVFGPEEAKNEAGSSKPVAGRTQSGSNGAKGTVRRQPKKPA